MKKYTLAVHSVFHTHLAGSEPIESLKLGSKKGYGHYIFVSRMTRQGSLNTLRNKIPEAVGYKDRVWSKMTRRVLLKGLLRGRRASL